MIMMISQEVLLFSREKVEETNVQKPGGLNSVREEGGGALPVIRHELRLVVELWNTRNNQRQTRCDIEGGKPDVIFLLQKSIEKKTTWLMSTSRM